MRYEGAVRERGLRGEAVAAVSGRDGEECVSINISLLLALILSSITIYEAVILSFVIFCQRMK